MVKCPRGHTQRQEELGGRGPSSMTLFSRENPVSGHILKNVN